MLKNYYHYQHQHRIILKSFMAILSIILLTGIFISPTNWDINPIAMTVQVLLITAIIISLLCFIKKELNIYKTLFILLITSYFCVNFWIFFDSAIMLAIFAMAPLIPIFLSDKIGFYVVATFNFIFGPLFIFFISNSDLKNTYQYVTLDPLGNTLNFLVIQIILVFVFLGTNNRVQLTKTYQKEIEQAKQINSIGQLAATIAHEIRNPITVVKGFAQLLEHKEELNEKERFYIQTMLTELEYTQMIINDYLSLTKPQTGDIQVIILNVELKKIVDLLGSFANNYNVGIDLKLNQEMTIKMNPIEFKQLFVNMIKNAIESMKNPGFITIEAQRTQNLVRISILDTGVGMSEAQVEKLGTPFYSLKDKGTGIGLTVCYNIVHKYKGEITVTSKMNEGTCFNIYLPLHKDNR